MKEYYLHQSLSPSISPQPQYTQRGVLGSKLPRDTYRSVGSADGLSFRELPTYAPPMHLRSSDPRLTAHEAAIINRLCDGTQDEAAIFRASVERKLRSEMKYLAHLRRAGVEAWKEVSPSARPQLCYPCVLTVLQWRYRLKERYRIEHSNGE